MASYGFLTFTVTSGIGECVIILNWLGVRIKPTPIHVKVNNSVKTCLRVLASYEAKTAKISNLWTFLPITQLIIHLIKIRQKPFLLNGL